MNRWAAFCRYTEHSGLLIDNNLSERTLRAIAIGRRNYLFAGSDRGARAAANHYSLISTCKLLGIDPYRYLRAIYSALPELDPQELPSLLPNQWFLKDVEAILVERRNLRRR